MALEIHKVRVRVTLPPRREPYWAAAISDDLTLGFRKIDSDRGSWIVRLRIDRSNPHPNDPPKGRYAYESLGIASATSDYNWAREAALKWRKDRAAGITSDVVTVADACREYVVDRRREKGEATARDAEQRFKRYVYGKSLGAICLSKLRKPQVKHWRDELRVSKSTANRLRTSLVAALNLAVDNRRVSRAVAQEWEEVKPYKAAGKRRDLFLDLQQRRALLSAAQGAVRDLMEGAALTGARAGELVKARRSQFDERTGIMMFNGKTGRRDVPLSPAAIALLSRLSKSKLPNAFLFVRDDGRHWAHSDWDDLVRAAAKAAGLPADPRTGVCLYTFRHCFITEALLGGMPTLEVARLVGTSVGMIEKHYGHLVASVARERLAKVAML